MANSMAIFQVAWVRALFALLVGCHLLPTYARPRHIVKAYILAGEANIEGYASTPHLHQLASSSSRSGRYQHLWQNGTWTTRDDVFVMFDHYRKDTFLHGPLSINGHFGSSINTFGPEIQLGHVLGNAYSDPVVLIKAGWKGRSLAVDFASSPSSTKPGYQWFRMIKAIETAATNLHEILGHKKYRRARLDIRGIVWWQGYSDLNDYKRRKAYGNNLEDFIDDIRLTLKRPELPVVVVELGGSGTVDVTPNELEFRKIQREVVEDSFGEDDFVQYVETAKESMDKDAMDSSIPIMYPNGPESAKTIYYGNPETHIQISQSIAVKLLAMDKKSKSYGRSGFGGRFLVIVMIGATVFGVVQKLMGGDDDDDDDDDDDAVSLRRMWNRFQPENTVRPEYTDIPMEIELDAGGFEDNS